MDDHERVLEWAEGQLEILKPEIERFENAQPDPLVGNRDSTRGEYVVRFDKSRIQRLPDDWVFRAGDIIHNMRVSLDYLTFGIVKPPRDNRKLARQTQFPILTKFTDWPTLVRQHIPTVSGEAEDAFKRLQPDYGRDTDHPHPLALLDALENVHKHRYLLTPRLSVASRSVYFWAGSAIEDASWAIGKLGLFDDGDEMWSVPIGPDDTIPNADFHASLKVCFDKEWVGWGMPVGYALEDIRDYIRKAVFPALEKHII